MTTWNMYRMWRQVRNAVANSGCTAEWLGDWKPTDVTFRARTQEEAQKKADKFWRESQFGSGSMVCIPADEDMNRRVA